MSEVGANSVLIVDDAAENLQLLVTIVRRGGLVPRPVLSSRLAIQAAVADPPDLVLLDVRMPEMSGFEVCKWLKQDERLRDIPVVFISGLQTSEDKVEGFRVGGVDYVTRPFHEQEVLARIKTHLHLKRLQTELVSNNSRLAERVEEQAKATAAAQMATIFALAKLAEVRDDDTGRHVERVATFAELLAKRLRMMRLHVAELTPAFIDTLRQTATLHDIGKVGIPDAILLKPAKLTTEEFVVMKTHTTLGANTLASVLKQHPDNQFLRMGVDVAKSHHEMWDGSGYPEGLEGEQIPLAARIVSVADFYDALTSTRCYRRGVSHEETVKLIEQGSGIQFDPEIAAAFKALEQEFGRIRREMQA
jgi:putative two-component system response regulator